MSWYYAPNPRRDANGEAEPKREPTPDELYLKALELKCNYTVGSGSVYSNLKVDGGWVNDELRDAIEHYKKLAWGDE